MGCGKKVLVTFSATFNLADQITYSADVEMDGSVLEVKSTSERLGLTFISK